MSRKTSTDLSSAPTGQFLVYETEDDRIKIDVRLENETVWLTQPLMAVLFQKDVRTINEHIQNVYEERELVPEATIRKFRIVQKEGTRDVARMLDFFNLDMIISVGYRVKSHVATRFRIWATQRLKEYIIKGFVLDDERLKNLDQPFDYFEELTRRIQDIRTSERRFYQKIKDIYATSIDYDPTLEISINFFKTVQNKMHWAITGKTAAEIIHSQAMRRIPMHMGDWLKKLDAFLNINDHELLTHAGTISHEMARQVAESAFEEFNRNRTAEHDLIGNDCDRLVQQLPGGKTRKVC